jgi:hypothetical protein
MLTWRGQGQQVRLDWVADTPPEPGPDDFKIGTRHDPHEIIRQGLADGTIRRGQSLTIITDK